MGKHKNIEIGFYRFPYTGGPDDVGEFKWNEIKRELLEFNNRQQKVGGAAWSQAILKPNTARCSKNVEGWSVLPLNFNNKPYGPVRAALKEIGCAAVVHSTFSNCKDANHFRVVVRLSRPLRRWEAPVFHEFMNCQLGGGAEAVKTLAPMYFLPSYPTGKREHAFNEEFYGPTLDVEHVWQWLEGEDSEEEDEGNTAVLIDSNRPSL